MKTTGGPAFPSHGSMGEVTHEGMTLRDWFAGKVLQGFCAGDAVSGAAKPNVQAALAKVSYELADAMLAEREKS